MEIPTNDLSASAGVRPRKASRLKRMAKALRIALIVAAGAVFTYAGFLTWSYHYGVEAERTPFSPAAWKERAAVYAHDSDPGCIRGGMALDIVATRLLDEKPLADVKALLGEPDDTDQSSVRYALGQCSGFGWHDSLLQVNLNGKQRVINAVIRPDRPMRERPAPLAAPAAVDVKPACGTGIGIGNGCTSR